MIPEPQPEYCTAEESGDGFPAPVYDDPFGVCGRLIDGRYLVEQAVGRGGFGVVYRAWHLRLDSPVAMKVLRVPAQLDGGARDAFIERFTQEGKLLFRLGSLHPAIVRVFEAGVLSANDRSIVPFLAMDWLEGQSLDRHIRRLRELGRGSLALPDLLTLMHPVADGLALAHEQGVIHRDLKPANVFLTAQGDRVLTKLLDFGLAQMVGVDPDNPYSHQDTASACRSMTPAYAAPEQWSTRSGPVGPWTDVHALALICVELLSGRQPLGGVDKGELMQRCLAPVRPTPQHLGLVLASEIEAVFQQALCLDPRKRFRDARSFWTALCAAGNWTDRRSLSIARSELPELRAGRETPPALAWPLTTAPSRPPAGNSNLGPLPELAAMPSHLLRRRSRAVASLAKWFARAMVVVGPMLFFLARGAHRAGELEQPPPARVAQPIASRNDLQLTVPLPLLPSVNVVATVIGHGASRGRSDAARIRSTSRWLSKLGPREPLASRLPAPSEAEPVAPNSSIRAGTPDVPSLLELDVLRRRH